MGNISVPIRYEKSSNLLTSSSSSSPSFFFIIDSMKRIDGSRVVQISGV